jgi:hypothetical protein
MPRDTDCCSAACVHLNNHVALVGLMIFFLSATLERVQESENKMPVCMELRNILGALLP